MQTFLPYEDFDESAKCIDSRRLGKQRVEAWQIYNSCVSTNPSRGWRNHPAVKMWVGYEQALCLYGIAFCKEWIRRGYKDTMLKRFVELLGDVSDVVAPFWISDSRLHYSHRSNLIRKDCEFYSKLWPGVPNDVPYYWPVS